MTRINNIPPRMLTDQHLIVEYNEIRRPIGLAIKRHKKLGPAGFKNLPETYRLGGGHVLFFYDKLQYLHVRFIQICEEMKHREFNVNTDFNIGPINEAECNYLYNDWTPTKEDQEILKGRLVEKVTTQKTHKYMRKPFDVDWYIREVLEYER